MEQRSTDWFEWRKKGIGSSDVSAILDLSPYMTRYQLWRIKTGLDPQVVDNAATYRGRKFEDKARACFELQSFKEYEPKIFQSEQYPFMRVSLDGWNEEEREILEIKVPGKNTLLLAANSEIPDHYKAQIQYQMFVANAKKATYFAFDPDLELGFSIHVDPDLSFIKVMVDRVIEFWKLVQKRQAPEMSERDYLPFPDPLAPLISLYIAQKEAGFQRDLMDTREKIISKMTHPRMRGFGLTVYPNSNGTTMFRIQKDANRFDPTNL